MKTCPRCHSLVDEQNPDCGYDDCPVRAEAAAAAEDDDADIALSTVALTKDQLQALSEAPKAHRPAVPRVTAETPIPPVATNRAAEIASQLAMLALIPLFPIAFAAFIAGLIGLARASQYPQAPRIGRAWLGVIAGLLLTVTWLLVTFWYFRQRSG